jgi:hypothetical protein
MTGVRLVLLVSIAEKSDTIAETSYRRMTRGAGIGGISIWDNRVRKLGAPRWWNVLFHCRQGLRDRAIRYDTPAVLAIVICPFVRRGNRALGHRSRTSVCLKALRAHRAEESLCG